MHKQHVAPEFQVICQNQANAKFFVASGPVDPSIKQFNGKTDNMVATTFGMDGEDVGGDSVW